MTKKYFTYIYFYFITYTLNNIITFIFIEKQNSRLISLSDSKLIYKIQQK